MLPRIASTCRLLLPVSLGLLLVYPGIIKAEESQKLAMPDAASPVLQDSSAASTADTDADVESLLPPTVRVFEFRTLNSQEFLSALRLFEIEYDSVSTLSGRYYVRFASPQMADKAKRLWARLDPPQQSIELRFELVQAMSGTEIKSDLPPSRLVLGELREQLVPLFRYSAYRSLSTCVMVTGSGNEVQMALQGLPVKDHAGDQVIEYFGITLQPQSLLNHPGNIHLSELNIVRVLPFTRDEPFLQTNLNVRDGQTVILGGTQVEGRTYIILVTARVVE